MASHNSYSDTDRHRREQGSRHQTARQKRVHFMPTGGESESRKHPLDVSASKPGDGKRARHINIMASNSSYLEIVRANSVLKQLLKPHELIEGLVKLDQYSGKPQEALLEQVEVARGLRKLTWLSRVANEANEVQFHSRAWIEDNIAKLKPIQKSKLNYAEMLVIDMKHKSPPPKSKSRTEVVKPRGSSPKLNFGPSAAPRQLRRESQEQALYTDTGESTSTSGARHGDRVRPPGAESSSVPATVPASRNDKNLCPIPGCFKICNYPKKHAYALHIPGIFKEGLNLETATPKRITALKLVTNWLLGTRATIMGLVCYVERIDLLAGLDNRGMTSAQTKPMEALCSAMNLEVPKQFTLRPLNSPAALLHWKALNLVISQLQPNQRQIFMEKFPDTEARTPENLEDVYELPNPRAVPVRDDRSAKDITEDDLKRVAKMSKEKKKGGINDSTCHKCRQKTSDMKTICRSGRCFIGQGQFCGPCLWNGHGEDAKAALKNPYWECPPCRQICNCSSCSKKQGKVPQKC